MSKVDGANIQRLIKEQTDLIRDQFGKRLDTVEQELEVQKDRNKILDKPNWTARTAVVISAISLILSLYSIL